MRDNALLVKLSDLLNLALKLYRTMLDIKKGKGPTTLTTLKKMLKSFDETGSLEDRLKSRRLQTSVAIVYKVEHDADTQSTSSEYGECSALAI